ncbi:MAG: transglutaminase-like domain-containing protein [Actinomycetota bacterium]|nr:transglutaminase-like domain-containing protein [Actinomycetota bacterium]
MKPSTAIARRGRDAAGINELAYLVVDAGEQVQLDAKVRLVRRTLGDTDDAPGDSVRLSDEQRRLYLRGTTMVPANGPVAEEARRIVDEAGAHTASARAWALFSELALHYRYVYPPKRRGAAAMLEERAGDCGEFSFLFAAWCRSCGIPARTMIGTWARGRTQAHVWSEFHVDDIGWVAADASMAALAHQTPWQLWLMGRRAGDRQDFFGALPANRLAFSIDPDVGLNPGFASVAEGGEPDVHVGGQPLRWGRDTIGGAAPYLQPAYPRFPHPPRETPAKRWNEQAPVGSWRIRHSTPERLAVWLGLIASVTAVRLLRRSE